MQTQRVFAVIIIAIAGIVLFGAVASHTGRSRERMTPQIPDEPRRLHPAES